MIVLASLVFAVAFSALPSTEPPEDDDEYAQYRAYIERRRARAAKAKQATKASSDPKRKLELEGKEDMDAERGWKGGGDGVRGRGHGHGIQVPRTGFIDPWTPSPKSAPASSRAFPHSLSFPTFPPSTSQFFSPTPTGNSNHSSIDIMEGEEKCGLRVLRRVSSVPSLSLSATSSRQDSFVGSPETSSIALD
ncbi:hypothetical protein IAR50_007200 [Cryptococcus sp. DSM 104548]